MTLARTWVTSTPPSSTGADIAHVIHCSKQVAGRWSMLLSYWDGGCVVADVTRARRLSYLASSNFTIPGPELLESTGPGKP